MRPETLGALLDRAADVAGTGLRFLDRRERQSWAEWSEIRRGALEVCGALEVAGVAPGERVALVYPTGLAFFHAFFGILLVGAVPVPLYPPVRLGRLDEYHRRTAAMLRAVDARLVLAEPRIQRLLGPTVALARPPLGCRRLAQLPVGRAAPVPASAADLALVQFSSGTTVDPKPVALSHRAILAQVRSLNSFWPDSDGPRHSGVSWLPLYHDMGLIGCVFPALERPGTLTLLPPEVFVARPAVWLRALSRTRATISVAPNFAYGLCVEKIRDEELEGVDLSRWKVALNGAEAVAPAVLRSFQERFARWGFAAEALTPVYGLSEATLAVTFSALERPFSSRRFDREALARDAAARPDPRGVELASVGRPLPGVEVAIVDGSGAPLSAGRVGRVKVRGPSLMEGYLGRPRATAEVLEGGWLDTGDLGFLEGGELFLTGRAKDIVILRGRNHAPMEIEQAAAGVEGVRKGCVVAVGRLPEGAASEQLLLFVEHRRGASEATRAGLARACAEAVLAATALRPHKVIVLAPGTLPRTSSGKLRRGETLRRHLAGELSPPRPVTPWLLAGAFARSALAYARADRGGASGV